MTLPTRQNENPNQGYWESWPSLPKLFFLLTPVIGLMVVQRIPPLVLFWTGSLTLLVLSAPGKEWLWTRILPMVGSIAFFAVWIPWTQPGIPFFEDIWWSPTNEGLTKGFSMLLKGTGIGSCFLSVVRSFQQTELLATLQKLGTPRLFLTIGWITVQQTQRLLREWGNLSQAHRARGAFLNQRTDRTRLMASSWAQLFVRVQKRSDDLGDALKSRAFSRQFQSLKPQKGSPPAWVASGMVGFLTALLIGFDLWAGK